MLSRLNILYIVLLSSFMAAIFTTLIYGSPQFPDTWIQLRIAREALSTSHLRVWDSYDTNWPLVNIMLSLLSYLTGLDPRLSIYLVLVSITGFSIIPLYMILHDRRGKISLFSVFFLIGMLFEPMYLTLISSFQKEAAPLLIFNLLLMIIVTSRKWYSLMALLTIGVLLGHHFLSLYIILLLITTIVYDYINYLKTNEKPSFNAGTLVLLIVAASIYQYVVGYRFVKGFEYYSFTQSDIFVLLGFYALSFILIFGRKKDSVRRSTQLLIFIIVMISYLSIRYLGVFGFNLPRPSIIELFIIVGYLALIYNSLRIKDIGIDKALIPAITLTLYGITLEPIYGGVTVLIKALRRVIPLLSLQAAIKPIKIASIIFLITMIVAFIAHIEGYIIFGGPALYKGSEVNDAQTIALLLDNSVIKCSWRTGTLLKYYNPNIRTIGLTEYNKDTLLVLSSTDIMRGLITEVWYQYINISIINKGENLVYNSGIFYIYR